jgi:hypothetical protein
MLLSAGQNVTSSLVTHAHAIHGVCHSFKLSVLSLSWGDLSWNYFAAPAADAVNVMTVPVDEAELSSVLSSVGLTATTSLPVN